MRKMKSHPNQRKLVIHTKVLSDMKRKKGLKGAYQLTYNDDIFSVVDKLNPTELKLWLYLKTFFDESTSDCSKCIMFSPADAEERIHVDKANIRKAFEGMKEKGFIVRDDKGCYHFFETPEDDFLS